MCLHKFSILEMSEENFKLESKLRSNIARLQFSKIEESAVTKKIHWFEANAHRMAKIAHENLLLAETIGQAK